MTTRSRHIPVLLLLLVMAAVAWSQELVIDDFSSGPLTITLPTGGVTSRQINQPATTVVGNFRTTFLVIPSDPYNQQAVLHIPGSVGGGPLTFSSGVRTFHGLQLIYGLDVRGQLQAAPMSLNLGGYDRFRIYFDALDTVLNFVILVQSLGGGTSEAAQNLNPIPLPNYVDFLFSSFTTNATPADFSNLAVLLFLNQTGQAAGSSDFAITKLVARSGP